MAKASQRNIPAIPIGGIPVVFDIEGFITDFLKLPILYEAFAEDDPSKIGFLSDGITPLIVYRAGKKTPVVFPKDTIVIERFLQRSDESGRRRFTLAHEAAHFILNRHVAYANGLLSQ